MEEVEYNTAYEAVKVKSTSPKLDDKAYAVAEFIQKLGKVQDDQFEELYKEAQTKGWFEGFGVDEEGECVARGWLFDYCFNDNSELFSEYCDADYQR